MLLGERIRKIREVKGWTQADVAHRINISPSAYGQIERKAGQASYGTLCKIALALDVSVLFLIDIENDNYIPDKNKS
jgi:transcriptional regulator with XRE-family HTH domain